MRRANATILFVLVASFLAIALDAKLWPFNNYPMFAHTVDSWPKNWARGDISAFVPMYVAGVSEDGEEIQLEAEHLAPQDQKYMMMSLNFFLGNGRPDSPFPGEPAEDGLELLRRRVVSRDAFLQKAMGDLRARYERRRDDEEEPDLVGIRLYRVHLDLHAPETLSFSQGWPDARRELLWEQIDRR